jgi:CheY-like chemotaxis protein
MILLVEDHAQLGPAMRLILKAAGHEVILVASGEQAVEFLNAHEPPALVLLDADLPGISGLDVLRYIRARPVMSEIPVIVDTAIPTPELRAEIAARGATLIVKGSREFSDFAGAVARRLAPG